ncbi:MAG TPA: CPBP family intramembrane glutamic endopeptidase [Conexibacter sp.]|nr:CPBP family intramembrane glutamic endopeptidase [Conexibacter sp.]
MSSAPPSGSWLPPVAEPPVRSGDDDGDGRWPPWTAAAALLTAFGLALVGAVLIGAVGAAFGASLRDPPPAVNIVATFVQDGAFVAAAVIFAARAGRVLPAQFGFVRTRLRQAVGWMVLAYLGYVVLGQLWAQLVHTSEKDNLPTSLGVSESTVALVAVCVLVTTIAPLAEETLFRGYIFGALRNWRGPWPAALITGIAFGAIHGLGATPAVFLVPLAIFGIALCLVRERTGSLLPCIALHAINNSLAFGVAEHWTAGQTLLLGVGTVSVTMLVCAALVGRSVAPSLE